MRLRILGDTGKDRGTQLETLTGMILEALNYSDISTNKISYGGHEIDVEGRFTHPSVGDPRTTRLICECKAYSKTLGTTDWMKFLGKIFTEELSSADPLSGLMIALSGVNGNVLGQYEEIQKRRSDIQIVTGEKLVETLKKIYPLRDPQEITREVYESTAKTITGLELAYFERQFIYIVAFSDNTYTTVSANRSQAASNYLEMIELIKSLDDLGDHVDLSIEREYEQRKEGLQKIILTTLLSLERPSEIAEIPDEWRKLLGANDQIDVCDLEDLIPEMVLSGLLTQSDNMLALTIAEDRSVEERVRLLRHLLGGSFIVPSLLQLIQYDALIDDSILVHMESDHNCTPVPDGERSDLIKILQWSPSALFGAINPPRRSQSQEHLRMPGDFAYVYLRKNLIDRFFKDYNSPTLSEYFRVHRKIHEIETTSKMLAKSDSRIELEIDVQHRLGIMPADKSLGGGYLLITMKLDLPQPWEPLSPPKKNSDDDGTAHQREIRNDKD